MGGLVSRVMPIWRRTISLSWPIAVEQTLNTLMRTVDILVTGLFSPAAVAAVGLSDLYAQIPLRIGQGLGSGAIAISSQDTGRGAEEVRDMAITQALVIGFLAGLPLVLVGLTLSRFLIAVLGAEAEVVRLAGVYLSLIFAGAPGRIVGLVGAQSLQGTGDTRTPMLVNVTANVINIVGTVGLALGLGPLPRLGIVGVGLATFGSRIFEAVTMVAVIASSRTNPSLVRPKSLVTTKQLLGVGLPHFAEVMSTSVANFPFNALLLTFGTEVTAAYHIGRRIYQQFTGPLYRAFGVVASIIIGQTLGEGKPSEARFAGFAITAFSVLTLGIAGIFLIVGAELVGQIFTDDIRTLRYAVRFTRTFGFSMVFFGVFSALAGCLRGAGDTRTPFYARFTGTFGFMLGFSYVFSIILGYGLHGVYAGIILSYAWWALVVVVGFLWGDWADTAAAMIAERADIPE